ncbi:MAG: SEL1-like repeat protein [Gammaproteobacteria bacterium]|nr:SEL1-like repeat protein [Gammaproteobacteria bacterium]MBU2428156.1 SEL1-like repeat protein [Gammaproteobacteria bacterium]
MYLKRYCCFLLAIVLSTAAQADFAAALKLYQNEDYQQALPELKTLAQLGHPHAQLLLADSYQYGHGTDIDLYQAYAWALTAKGFQQPGAAEKYVELRNLLPSRRIGKQVYVDVSKNYGAVALQGSLYPIGHDVYLPQPQVKPLRQPKPDYTLHEDVLAWAVVIFDINENGLVENSKVALSFPPSAIDTDVLTAINKWTYTPPRNAYGDAIRLDNQSLVFSTKKLTTAKRKSMRDHQAYIDAVKDAADAGFAEYQYKYGLIAQAGLVKGESALDWYLKAAINGNHLAQYSVAQCALNGSQCDKDSNKAINWLTYAAKDGNNPQASYLLAQQLLDSDNIQFDPERAAEYLAQAAELNYGPAIVEYASLLAMSDNPKLRSAEKAMQLAEQGLKADPNNPKLLSTIGIALIETGMPQRGEEMLRRAIDAAEERDWATDNYRELLTEYAGQLQTSEQQ